MTGDSLTEISFSTMHDEIDIFAKAVSLTVEERAYLSELIYIVDKNAVGLLGQRAKVEAFGSFAMGLSAHYSDLDLVILNILRIKKEGFKIEDRARAIQILYNLANRLHKNSPITISQMRVHIPVLNSALSAVGGGQSKGASAQDRDRGRDLYRCLVAQ